MVGTSVASKFAHNIAMRFRTEKFTWDIGQFWNEYVSEYQQASSDYQLGNAQKLQYLQNILGGDAKRFYLNNVLLHVNGYRHAVEPISSEYNSVVRQNRVKNILAPLRLRENLGENGDEGEALANVYKIITELSPKVPASHRGDAHKIEFL